MKLQSGSIGQDGPNSLTKNRLYLYGREVKFYILALLHQLLGYAFFFISRNIRHVVGVLGVFLCATKAKLQHCCRQSTEQTKVAPKCSHHSWWCKVASIIALLTMFTVHSNNCLFVCHLEADAENKERS